MKNYKKILFINYGGIGDEILFLPAIASVKKQYLDAKITLALENRAKCIKELTADINETISVDIKAGKIKKYFNILNFILKVRKKKFDCVISSGKSPFVAIILFLTGIKERIGYKTRTSFLLTREVELNENQYASKMYHDLVKPITNIEFENPSINIDPSSNSFSSDVVLIHPGVSLMSVSKNILKTPKSVFWINLIKGLLKKNKKVMLLGAKDDENIINEIIKNEDIALNKNFINYYNKTKSIMDMAHLMKNASCVICADSAPMHIAIALKVKTFAIFAPTNEKKLVPDDEDITIITNKINCRPCLWDKRSCNCENSFCLNIDYNMILDKIN